MPKVSALAALLVTALLLVLAPTRAEAAFFFDSTWGTQGDADGQFESPTGVMVAPSGNVYVADTGNDRVQRFDADGSFLGKWGRFGVQAGQFNRPVALAMDAGGNNLYVVDNGNNRVQKFDPTGTFQLSFGGLGSLPGRFNDPTGVAVDATGDVYVVDSGNNRVQKFTPNGTFISSFGQIGDTPGEFFIPVDVALDFAGNIYVSDGGNHRVQKFDQNGGFITEWGTFGTGLGQFNVSFGTSTLSGSVYTADHHNHRVHQFSDSGSHLFTTGGLGSGPGEFRFPAGVSAAGTRLYVADMQNHRVQRFVVSATAIVVVKDAQPNDPQDFSFTAGGGLSPASFVLDDDGNPNNGTSNTRAFAAPPGSGYSLAEATPPGNWDLTAATCSDGSDPSNIDVSEDEVVTCTFTNRKRGRLVIVHDSVPDEPQDFGYSAGGGLSPASFQLDDDGNSGNELSDTQVFNDVVPGMYSITQNTPAGWGAPQVTCSNGSVPSQIAIAPGETVTCTFRNRSDTAGEIIVVKDADPNDPQDFSFSAGGGLAPASFLLDDDGSNTNTLSNTQSFIVSPRDGYSVAETPVSGWSTTATCSDGSPPSNIDVAASETITCTFTNRRAGTISVFKDAQPNDPQDFNFTAGGGLSPTSFTLDDDASSSTPSSRIFDQVPPGSGYSITETVPPGWAQASVNCSGGDSPSNITVSPGENVSCLFTNVKQAQITVVKDAQPNDPQDFTFSAGGGLSPASFVLDDDGDESNDHARTRVFPNLTPGSGYSVAEDPAAGWETSGTCSDGSPPSNISLSTAEHVTCTFVNLKRGSLTVNLDTRPDGPQDFDFTAGGGLSPSSFQLDDDGDDTNDLSSTRTFTDLLPQDGYSVTQTPLAGWVQEEATCSDGSSPSNVDIAPGENVTCTFAVSTRAKITVVKDAIPNDEQDFEFAAGGGLSPSSFFLDDDTIETNTLPSRRSFIVDPGSGYSVQEVGPPDPWVLDSAACSDGSPPSNIDVVAGEAVTCTFQNSTDTYVRPKGATPIRASLVMAFHPCGQGRTPNRTHGPPLNFPSCSPPFHVSTNVTVGTPDANGAAAQSQSFVKLRLRRTGGLSDIEVTGVVNDVRCRTGTTTCGPTNFVDGADYSGELRAALIVRITDQGAGDLPGTVVDVPLDIDWVCTGTSSGGIGASCPVNTTVEAVVPGAVPEGERAIWELAQLEVWDGGSDGDTATTPNLTFMRQGVFVP